MILEFFDFGADHLLRIIQSSLDKEGFPRRSRGFVELSCLSNAHSRDTQQNSPARGDDEQSAIIVAQSEADTHGLSQQ